MARASDPILSVVIPCRDSADTLGGQLEALAAQTWKGDYEVIVADNGSRDGSAAISRRLEDRVSYRLRTVDAGDVRGAAHARNVGARAAKGKWLAFVDADDVVDGGWVAAMAAALQEHPFVASRFAFERINPEWLVEAIGSPQAEGIQRLWYPPYAFHAGGSGLGVHRELHQTVGGFDEALPRLMDTDYCIRVQKTGASLHFASDAVVHVRHRESTTGLFRQAALWARYNTLMFARYRPPGTRLEGAWKVWRRNSRRVAKRVRGAWHSRDRRASWAFQAGWQWGLLKGSLLYGVPPLVRHAEARYTVPGDAEARASLPRPSTR